MKVYTTETIPGKEVELIDIVSGNIALARHLGKDIVAGVRSMVGGEIKTYTSLLIDARKEAIQRMKEEAKLLGGDAIVMTRLETSCLLDGSIEVVSYGTAVRFIEQEHE